MNTRIRPEQTGAARKLGDVRQAIVVLEDHMDTRCWLEEIAAQAYPECELLSFATLSAAKAWLDRHVEPAVDDGGRRSLALALVDLELGDGSGIEFIRAVKQQSEDTRVVVTTIYDDDGHLFEALAAGADGYLLKDQTSEEFALQLKRIDDGDVPLSPSIARRVLEHFRKRSPQLQLQPEEAVALTRRETEILGLLGKGMSGPEAARILGLSMHTVSWYIREIYSKLHISTRAEAALEAARRGLI